MVPGVELHGSLPARDGDVEKRPGGKGLPRM